MKKILFCGGKKWGYETFEYLLKYIEGKEYEVIGLIANNSEFNNLDYSAPIYKLAIKSRIPIFIPQNGKQLNDIVSFLKPDFLFSIFYDSIINKDVLNQVKYGCINLHMADSEKYRGCYSTIHAILNSDNEFGVTLHYMDEGIDTGDIIDKTIWNLKGTETGFDLYINAKDYGVKLFIKNLASILECKNLRKKQNFEVGKHYPRILPKKVFQADELIKEPLLFIKSVRAFDFQGFEGLELIINENRYVIERK